MSNGATLTCPRCHGPLTQTKMSHGIFWGCGNCGGRAVTVELLRRTFTPESINPLWLHAIRGEGQSSSGCPMCKRPMIEVTLSNDAPVRVDVCKLCHFVWFDSHETDSLVPRPSPDPETIARENREKVKPFSEKVDRYQLPTTSSSELWRSIADIFLR